VAAATTAAAPAAAAAAFVVIVVVIVVICDSECCGCVTASDVCECASIVNAALGGV
jgi:hypothetical protein